MSLRNYLGLVGTILVIAGGMTPMLRIPIIGNWNYWDIDTVLASIVYVFAAAGLLGAVLHKPGLVKFSGWAVLIVVAFTLVAVYFKVNNYFSFIPLKKLASLASNLVHYKWLGWSMLFCGALIMIISSRKPVNKLNRSSSN
jgi:predicted tellurium resistance membrane protein TerC